MLFTFKAKYVMEFQNLTSLISLSFQTIQVFIPSQEICKDIKIELNFQTFHFIMKQFNIYYTYVCTYYVA